MYSDNRHSSPATAEILLPGAGCESLAASRSTVKRITDIPRARPSHGDRPKPKTARERKSPGKHVRPGVYEATRILKEEGFRVFRNHDPGFPFHLDAWKDGANIFIRVGRPNDAVFSAALAVKQYLCDICCMMSWKISPSDIFQFWIFSRQKGLLRYQVFDWGIGNVVTMQNLEKKVTSPAPVPKTGPAGCPVQQSRNKKCPACRDGAVQAPD